MTGKPSSTTERYALKSAATIAEISYMKFAGVHRIVKKSLDDRDFRTRHVDVRDFPTIEEARVHWRATRAQLAGFGYIRVNE